MALFHFNEREGRRNGERETGRGGGVGREREKEKQRTSGLETALKDNYVD